jgi:hypothetical protein
MSINFNMPDPLNCESDWRRVRHADIPELCAVERAWERQWLAHELDRMESGGEDYLIACDSGSVWVTEWTRKRIERLVTGARRETS